MATTDQFLSDLWLIKEGQFQQSNSAVGKK